MSIATRKRRIRLAFVATGVFILGALALALVHYVERQGVIAQEGMTLHRTLSQRVDQHDAHLTSLAALAQVAEPLPLDVIRIVAGSMMKFYPRIARIDMIDLMHPARGGLIGSDVDLAPAFEAAKHATNVMTLVPLPGEEGLILLKRAPATPVSQYFIVFVLDLNRLIDNERLVVGKKAVQLLLEGKPLLNVNKATGPFVLSYEKVLDSKTQPITLCIFYPLTMGELFVWQELILMLVLIAWAAFGLDRLMLARKAAREAARQALIATQDARLAHASRVNTMGELASGIAHELTQPLTAILSQSQAGQRLAMRGELDRVAILSAFEASARNAKRAGDILTRLRAWITKSQPVIEDVDLVQTIGDVVQLIGADATSRTGSIRFSSDMPMMPIRADRVQIEQVLFNLLRNALDATAAMGARAVVEITLITIGQKAQIRIRDNGPGLTTETQIRLFEPFFTTKPGGMGLGLALCLTLVDRAGGTLEARNALEGGAEFILNLPLPPEDIPFAPREAAE